MSNIIPIRLVSRADVDETAVTEQMEQIPGEVDLDQVIKAQLSAPRVARRITELEDCLWALAQELLRLDPRSTSAERARLLLNNRLEITQRSGTSGAANDAARASIKALPLPFGSKQS